MTKAVAFTEALAMFLKVRKLNTWRYKGLEEWYSSMTVEFHIDTEWKKAMKLKNELIKDAHCDTIADVSRIDNRETICIKFRWDYDNSIQEI